MRCIFYAHIIVLLSASTSDQEVQHAYMCFWLQNMSFSTPDHATNLRDETGADVLFIDAEKHGISLKVMSERAGCAVEKFPCVFVDDVYLEPLPPVPGQPHYTYC